MCMSISAHHLTYSHPNKEVLFRQIDLVLSEGQKAALVGNNGCGKSTLLRLLAGEIKPAEGEIVASAPPYYVPQHFGQYDRQTVATALRIAGKLEALHQIEAGHTAPEWFDRLADDWLIEQRSEAALSAWGLHGIPLDTPMGCLSGGEKTKVFLAGLQIHVPQVILLDEPTNHLDAASREKVYAFLASVQATVLVVSHDRHLLNRLPTLYELTPHGIAAYGGNYEFYKNCKEAEEKALTETVQEKEKTLRLARKAARETAERKQKQNVRSEKGAARQGISRMALNTLKDKAEKSTTKLAGIHTEKIEKQAAEMNSLRERLPDRQRIKIDFGASAKPEGKLIVQGRQLNFCYPGGKLLWKEPLDFQLRSGERVEIRGNNGSGKTTLLKLIAGEWEPADGTMERAPLTYVYVDQAYALINDRLTVYEQVEAFNERHFREDELKMRLHRYLFRADSWDKPCAALSGGEKMRLLFCCVMTRNQTPDLLMLDEPTNNLDLQSLEIITEAVRNFHGTVVAVSHDAYFLREIGVQRAIELL